MNNSAFLSVVDTVLVIIDVQEKLCRFMYEKEKLLDSLQRLIQGARVLELPIILTEQYPQGLGPTVPELVNLLPGVKPLPKRAFSCYRDAGFRKELEAVSRKQVLLTGIETHVCVYQTAVDLLTTGYTVQVVTDCVSSRTPENKELGIQRMSLAGGKPTGMEMALFELLEAAEGERFKAISKIVK
ncbi:MAG: hydrolase [Dehalococcoidia bacterium]|nr:MAG: hydrolase [Dehalococcoidia bacterium]